MNTELVTLLNEAISSKQPMTPTLALAICQAASKLHTLVPASRIAAIQPYGSDECAFAMERIENIIEEIKPLHLAHWNETEEHRHGLPFNPDYATFVRYEQAGRYVLFTLRSRGRLLGNCAMYLDMSAHTQTLIATEDTLYLLPEARKGRRAMWFVKYIEDALRELGVREVCITVKTVNKAERFFRMNGYIHVENGLTKILEVENVQLKTAEA